MKNKYKIFLSYTHHKYPGSLMRIAFITIVMYAALYADICSDDIRIKVKPIDETMLVKFTMRDTNNFRNFRDKKAKDLRYMTHLVLKKGKNILYDASTSDSIGSYQRIQLFVDNTNSMENLDAFVTFNTGEQIKCSQPIRQRVLEQLKLQSIPAVPKEDNVTVDYHITHPPLWKATSFDAAIKILYGTSKVTTIDNVTHSFYDMPESNTTGLFINGCGEYIDFSATPEVESIMLLASYNNKVVQYVMKIPNNHGFGSTVTSSLSKIYSQRKPTSELRSFTSPITHFKLPSDKLKYTVAIVYRLKNGQVLRQDFKPHGLESCGVEPQLSSMQIELGKEYNGIR